MALLLTQRKWRVAVKAMSLVSDKHHFISPSQYSNSLCPCRKNVNDKKETFFYNLNMF